MLANHVHTHLLVKPESKSSFASKISTQKFARKISTQKFASKISTHTFAGKLANSKPNAMLRTETILKTKTRLKDQSTFNFKSMV